MLESKNPPRCWCWWLGHRWQRPINLMHLECGKTCCHGRAYRIDLLGQLRQMKGNQMKDREAIVSALDKLEWLIVEHEQLTGRSGDIGELRAAGDEFVIQLDAARVALDRLAP